jgi:hypothetical protein
MATLLESGGTVELWSGWAVRLPPSYYETNGDGSWSAWGADWTVDVIIAELAGQESGQLISPEEMLGQERTGKVSGNGWVGGVEFLRETDNGRDVYRLAANLAAINTSMSFWVSYFEAHQQPFAEELMLKVTHSSQARSASGAASAT